MEELNIYQCKYCIRKDECNLQDKFEEYAKSLYQVPKTDSIFRTLAYCEDYLLDTKEFVGKGKANERTN